jgi:hypothetical protein
LIGSALIALIIDGEKVFPQFRDARREPPAGVEHAGVVVVFLTGLALHRAAMAKSTANQIPVLDILI